MLDFVDSPFLQLNFDTGNSFIAGQDPVEFCRHFKDRISHVHVKDVSESLAAIARGGQTGIALSHCAAGEGANAANIRGCLEILRDNGYTGHLSIECEGQGGPLLEKSLHWLRQTLTELAIPQEK
jgi:sugar phosphate isomerase/epimerase